MGFSRRSIGRCVFVVCVAVVALSCCLDVVNARSFRGRELWKLGDSVEEVKRKLKEGRIVGGSVVPTGRWTFMALLIARDVSSGQLFAPCGGSLISPDHVLSAAHCVDSSFVYESVIIGDRNPYDSNFQGREWIDVTQVITHPSYNSNTNNNDIMVLKLNSQSAYTPIFLSFTQSDFLDLELANTPVTVAGWGATSEGGSSSNDLLEVDLTITSNSQCASAYGSFNSVTMICAWFSPGGRDSCQGDSGGPLFGQISGFTVQVGVVSFGRGCARPNTPGVYARVSNYGGFIQSNVPNLPLPASAPAAPTPKPTTPTPKPTTPPPSPTTQSCPAAFFDAQDGCDCCAGYGQRDPDCDLTPDLVYCDGAVTPSPAQFCNSANECQPLQAPSPPPSTAAPTPKPTTKMPTASGETFSPSPSPTSLPSSSPEASIDPFPVPVEWTCASFAYGRDNLCNCACGAWDPDCEIEGVQLQCNPFFVTRVSGEEYFCSQQNLQCARRADAPTVAPEGLSSPVIAGIGVGAAVAFASFAALAFVAYRRRRAQETSQFAPASNSKTDFGGFVAPPQGNHLWETEAPRGGFRGF